MMFENRENAAKLLLEKLDHYKNKNVIVAGIPRGAMPMAKIKRAKVNSHALRLNKRMCSR